MTRFLTYPLLAVLALSPLSQLPAQAAGGGAPVDKAVSRITGSKTYIPVTGLKVPIATWDGFAGMMAVDVGLDIKDDALRHKANALMPRLRDQLRRSVHSYMNGTYQIDQVPNLEMLGDRLQRVVDRALGEGQAEVTIASAT